MKIAVWRTGHEIADRVHDAVIDGLTGDVESCDVRQGMYIRCVGDINIGYGILRGMDEVFRACQKAGKPFFHIDRGYWKPGHYDGYYRVSLNGTQQTFGFDKLEPDYERWDALGIEVLPAVIRSDCSLVCPPTNHVNAFFNLNWEMPFVTENSIYRDKTFQEVPLQKHLDACNKLITFNSSVGWEALRQGIPVVSDPTHSIVGAYEKTLDGVPLIDLDARRRLFGIQASLQLTLAEIREGKLWPLLNRLMSISDGTQEKALHQMFAHHQ